MIFQSFWDKFEQTGSVKAYLDYVRNGKAPRNHYEEDDWDDDWDADRDEFDDWDEDDFDFDD